MVKVYHRKTWKKTMLTPTKITFYECFTEDILLGKKTITIRDELEKNFVADSVVSASTFENARWFCDLKILSVQPIAFNQLTSLHAQQENMTLKELKAILTEIYPEQNDLYIINFEVV